MRRSFLKQALVVLATCALFIPIAIDYGVPAQAATFTFSDSNCDSFSYNAATSTLSCVVSNPPTCTVTGSQSAQVNTQLTLTASCSPAATSYVWTGGSCATSISSQCQDTQTSTGDVAYTVKGSNANGPGPTSPQFVVNWSNTVVAPSGCSIAYSPSGNVAAGTHVDMTVNCSTGTAPFSYAWTGGFAAGQATQTAGGTANTSANGNVTVTNSANNKVVPWSVSVGGGGGGGGPISCPGFNNTTTIDMAWGSNVLANTENSGPFGSNDAIVVRFTTSGVTSATGSGQVNAYEFDGPPTTRTGSLSLTPCDFTVGLPTKGGGMSAFAGEVAPSVTTMLVAQKSGALTLQTNTTYYFNIRNTSGCSTSSCNMQIHLKKPSGS